jgi:polyhydroxyalkanoate synthase subunit PhaE
MPEMDPFESMRALAELWGRGGNAFLSSQQGFLRDMAEKMQLATAQPASADTAGFAAAQRSFSELWSSAAGLSTTLAKAMQGSEPAEPVVAEMLRKIFDPKGWFSSTDQMDETLQRMAEGPRLSDMWNVERRFLAVFNAWLAMRRRTFEHNTVMLDAWTRAAGTFARELNQRADKGEKLASWREMLALWVETANTTLLETQRSERYLQSQRDLLKGSTDLRLAQRELAEYYSEMFGYPTRAELDDVHKTVTELRRELRALRRERDASLAKRRAPAKRAAKKKEEVAS